MSALEEAAAAVATATQELREAEAELGTAQGNVTTKAQVLNEKRRVLDALTAGETPAPGETFEQRQAAKGAALQAYRDSIINGGITVDGIGTFDSNLESRLSISGAVQAAQIATAQGQPFSVDWTLSDNSAVNLDATEMVTVGMAFVAFISGAHAIARTIGAAILAAEDDEALDAIDITEGWN